MLKKFDKNKDVINGILNVGKVNDFKKMDFKKMF
jgi:hypothetical protein